MNLAHSLKDLAHQSEMKDEDLTVFVRHLVPQIGLHLDSAFSWKATAVRKNLVNDIMQVAQSST